MAIERAGQRLLTVPEVAERLRVHPITVRRLIKAGRLPAVRIGRAVRVRGEDVEAYAGGKAVVQLRPPLTAEESTRLLKLMEETFARRDRRGKIGIDTLELVRASRRELEERSERR